MRFGFRFSGFRGSGLWGFRVKGKLKDLGFWGFFGFKVQGLGDFRGLGIWGFKAYVGPFKGFLKV